MKITEIEAGTAPTRTMLGLRDEIDRIDDAMLDLVEARVALTVQMAALKHDDAATLKLRPRREAEVLERLTRRARNAPPAMIEHVWRTLMAYGLQDQAPMRLVLHADGTEADRLQIQDRVRGRFGPAAALIWVASRAEALDAARDTEAVAIVTQPPAVLPEGGTSGLRMFETLTGAGPAAYAIGRVAAADLVTPGAAR